MNTQLLAETMLAATSAADIDRSNAWGSLRARYRAVLKLRSGSGPLTAEELETVLPQHRADLGPVRPRSLRQVGVLFGVSKERIRQIEAMALARLERLSSR